MYGLFVLELSCERNLILECVVLAGSVYERYGQTNDGTIKDSGNEHGQKLVSSSIGPRGHSDGKATAYA